jgi:hypothetical protein
MPMDSVKLRPRYFLTLSVAVVCLAVGFLSGRISSRSSSNIISKEENHSKPPLSGPIIIANQINFAVITNLIVVLDKLTNARCLQMVKGYSMLNSKERLLRECTSHKVQLITDLSAFLTMDGLEKEDLIEILETQCSAEISAIEGISSVPHSYEEVLSRLGPDDMLLYCFFVSKFRILMLENIESAIVFKMRNQEMSDLRKHIDSEFAPL